MLQVGSAGPHHSQDGSSAAFPRWLRRSLAQAPQTSKFRLNSEFFVLGASFSEGGVLNCDETGVSLELSRSRI